MKLEEAKLPSPPRFNAASLDALELQAKFRQHLSDSLAPILDEVVTDQTRRLQQQLLFLASVLVLLALSWVEVSGNAGWNGLKFKIVAHSASTLAFWVTLYFEVLVATRSLLDWTAWRIRTGAAEIYLSEAQANAFYGIPSQSNASESNSELFNEAALGDYADGESAISEAEAVIRADRRRARKRVEFERKLKTAWIRSRLPMLRPINALRGAVEVLFPVVFGALSLVLSACSLF